MERIENEKEYVMRKDVCVFGNSCVLIVHEDVLDVLGVHDDVHDILHVSKKNVTPYDFVEGKSSVLEKSCDSSVLHPKSSVPFDESQSESPTTVKVKLVCYIGTQIDDSSCSCTSFEGIVPYKKPIIQDVQMYQTQNVWGTKG